MARWVFMGDHGKRCLRIPGLRMMLEKYKNNSEGEDDDNLENSVYKLCNQNK